MLFDKILPPAKVHMLGIGGISMSGLAEILKNKGYTVSGSDINQTHITDKLESSGINVIYEHNAENVINKNAVIYTASIKPDNPEYQKALELDIPVNIFLISRRTFIMVNLLAATTLNESLAGIVAKLNELMNSFWIYIVLAMAAVVVVWGAYIGIRVAIANRNEDKINARGMVKSLIIGIIIMFVIAMGAPLLINGLSAWVGIDTASAASAALVA